MPRTIAIPETFQYGDYIYCVEGLLDGISPSAATNIVLRYNTVIDNWEVYDTIDIKGWAPYSTMIGEWAYLAGGGIVAGWFKDSVFRYNVVTRELDTLPLLPEPLISGRAFNDNGTFHLLGGHNGFAPYAANYWFDTLSRAWNRGPFLPAGLQSYAIIDLDSIVYMIGGRGLGGFPASNVNLVYRTSTATFENRAPLPVAVRDAAYLYFNDRIYLFGGSLSNFANTDVIQIYDPNTDTWSLGPPMPFKRSYADAFPVSDGVIFIGGIDGVLSAERIVNEVYKITIFDPSSISAFSIDIEPDQCPNVLNLGVVVDIGHLGITTIPEVFAKSVPDTDVGVGEGQDIFTHERFIHKGFITVAIAGTPSLDVREIAPRAVTLMGLRSAYWRYEDVTSPPGLTPTLCECAGKAPDGQTDLVLRFRTSDILDSLGTISDGDVRQLTLHARSFDEREFIDSGCVTINIRTEELATESSGAGFSLDANAPNPFNPSTKINFTLPTASHVRIDVYNIMGQRVTTLSDYDFSSGQHSVTWNGDDDSGAKVSSGVYFYRMKSGEFTQTRKMVLLK